MTQSACNNTTPQGTGSCQIVVSVNGSAGDTCSFNVLLSNNGTTNVYTKSVTTLASGTFEYAGTLSGTATKAKTQMDTLAGTKIATGQSLTITEANKGKQATYTLTTEFYNLCGQNQNALGNASSDKTYEHKLSVTDVTCDFSH